MPPGGGGSELPPAHCWLKGGIDPPAVGGVDVGAGGDDLVDAVEQVVGELDVGGGEWTRALSGGQSWWRAKMWA